MNQSFQTIMALLDIAIFMWASGLGLTAFKTIMTGQRPVIIGKLLGTANLINRRSQPVGLVILGHTAKFPQRVLNTFT